MECLVRGLRLPLYWLPLQLTHRTLLILYYFRPCSSVWDISHNFENFFRLSPVKNPFLPGVIIASPINVHIHVQSCKGEETKERGWGLRKPLLENLLELKKKLTLGCLCLVCLLALLCCLAGQFFSFDSVMRVPVHSKAVRIGCLLPL